MLTTLEREKLVLRVLCLGTAQGPVKKQLSSMLRHYRWRSALHQVLFRAITDIPSDNPEILRQLLPARLTVMGFPDVEWDEFIAPHLLSKDAAITLVKQMVAGS